MQTKVVFVVYKTTEIDGKVVSEEIVDFANEREVADHIEKLQIQKGYTCKVEKELAVSDGGEMFIIKHDQKLNPKQAKEFKDFKDEVLEGLTGFQRQVLIQSGALKV